jgi:hypothetical protein
MIKPFFRIVFDSVESRDKVPAVPAQLKVHVPHYDIPDGGIGLAEIHRYLSSESPMSNEEGYDNSDMVLDVRIERAGKHAILTLSHDLCVRVAVEPVTLMHLMDESHC